MLLSMPGAGQRLEDPAGVMAGNAQLRTFHSLLRYPMPLVRETNVCLTLEQLEGVIWDDPDQEDTLMVQRVHAIRKKRIGSLTDDELRLAVSQCVGIPFVLDVAFQRLIGDPLLDADCYPGDLLSALITAKDELWVERPHLRSQLVDLYAYAMAQPLDATAAFRESLGLPPSDRPTN